MYSHMMVGSNDIARSKSFYDAIFGAVGCQPATVNEDGRLFYLHNGSMFVVTRPIDGTPASSGNGSTIGFAIDDPVQIDAWHKAGVEHGGTAIEDPPGVRASVIGDLYLAYLRDPDGNKLCALYHMPTSE